jgi:hypothetical protein
MIIIKAIALNTVGCIIGQQLWLCQVLAIAVLAQIKCHQSIKGYALLDGIFQAMRNGML